MRPRILWQYLLIATAWIITVFALRFPGAEMNSFFHWSGDVTTQGLIQFLFAMPRSLATDWHNPALHTALAWGQIAWLAGTLGGFVLFVFSPTLVRRQNTWGRASQTLIRCLALLLLVFPLASVAPAQWSLPYPRLGMDMVSLAHVLIFAALLLTPARLPAENAFEVLSKAA